MRKPLLALCAMLLTTRAMGEDLRGRGDAGPPPALLAAAQTTCPVMEGKRINPKLFVDYQGVRIYVCCNACVKAVRKDPGKYRERVTGVYFTCVPSGASFATGNSLRAAHSVQPASYQRTFE